MQNTQIAFKIYEMKVFLDYDVLGIPDKDNMALPIYLKIKDRIIKFAEQFNGKYDRVFTIVTLNVKEGLCFYYISDNIELRKEWEKIFSTVELENIAKEIRAAENN